MARNTKMSRSLVALSASAVAAVYLAGFGITQAADTSLGQAAANTPVAVASSPTPTSAPTVSVAPATGRSQRNASAPTSPSAPTSDSSPTSTSGPTSPPASSTSTSNPSTSVAGVSATSPSSTASTTAAYKDGTYTGTGNSRRGGISVSVTVQGGRITNVAITGSSTEYPVSRISSLPGQVVSKQSAQVNNVSGATYSAQAFQLAVQQALTKAKA